MDAYSRKQLRRDREYEEDTRRWLETMTDAERAEAAGLGIVGPKLDKGGNGGPNGDVADSPRASDDPNISGAVADHLDPTPPPELEAVIMRRAVGIVRQLLADVLAQSRCRLTLECLALATGLRCYGGDSMTVIAAKYGISRAAVSKRCVDITEALGLSPSRAMRGKAARQVYREAQLRRHRGK